MDWDIAASLGGDREGLNLLMSGLTPFICSLSAIFVLSCIAGPGLITLMTLWTSSLSTIFTPYDPIDDEDLVVQGRYAKVVGRRLNWTVVGTLFFVLGAPILCLLRPPVPFSHLTGALPWTVFLGLTPRHGRGNQQWSDARFPFTHLLAKEYWEPPRDHYKGWAPGVQGQAHAGDPALLPEWARNASLPQGFRRWDSPPDEDTENIKTSSGQRKAFPPNFYNPVTDPLRITNLDLDPFLPLTQALAERSAPISHVVMVMMESARKDVFPFKAGSRLHDHILAPYKGNRTAIDRVNGMLARLTATAEKVTGESSGFPSALESPADAGFGGINVDEVITSSSFSCKSVLVNHCGASPLPLDWLSETNVEGYQPCFNQILKLFNTLKGKNDSSHRELNAALASQHPLERRWRSFFIQSTTGQFSDQTKLMNGIGFDKSMYREDIGIITAKHYHSDMEKINYFG